MTTKARWTLDGVCLDCREKPRVRMGRCDPCATIKKRGQPRLSSTRYDWVVVERILRGRDAGRRPARLEKIEVVRLLLRSGDPIKSHPATERMDPATLQKWVGMFRAEALAVGLEMPLRFFVSVPELAPELALVD
ncbi:hypothetical protein [Umezawaea sp. NPDC059074]|uniref:hypothetical protein n=1 Tax=Umezawaea sp. NPDC059074 TaxID=3346716 RepID=UPI0036B7A63B